MVFCPFGFVTFCPVTFCPETVCPVPFVHLRNFQYLYSFIENVQDFKTSIICKKKKNHKNTKLRGKFEDLNQIAKLKAQTYQMN